MRALIGTIRVELLVDSGSMPCILDKSVYDSLQGKAKRPLKVSPVHLFGASGVQIEVYGQTMVELNFGEDTFEIPCLIADLAHTMGVLGMNFFYSVECELNLAKGYLDFQGRRYPLYQQELAGCNKVFLSHPEKVQEGACVKLKGILEGDICVDEEELTPWRPDTGFVEETGLHTLDGAIKVSKEGRVEVSWMNLGGGEVKLNPGTLLGYVEAGKSKVSVVHLPAAAEDLAEFPPQLQNLFEDVELQEEGLEATNSVTQSPDPVVNLEKITDSVTQSPDPVVNLEKITVSVTQSLDPVVNLEKITDSEGQSPDPVENFEEATDKIQTL